VTSSFPRKQMVLCRFKAQILGCVWLIDTHDMTAHKKGLLDISKTRFLNEGNFKREQSEINIVPTLDSVMDWRPIAAGMASRP